MKLVISGWLTKKGQSTAFSSGKQWHRRYFELWQEPMDGTAALKYFTSDDPAEKPRGIARVHAASSVRVLDDEASLADHGLDKSLAGKRVFVFQATPAKDKTELAKSKFSFILEAENAGVMHGWVTALSEAIADNRHHAAAGTGMDGDAGGVVGGASAGAADMDTHGDGGTNGANGGKIAPGNDSWARSNARVSAVRWAGPPSPR
jgi:hypothetical protein